MDLIYLSGKNQGSRCQLTPPGISIGSEADNDLQLTEEGVSQYHAMISFDGNDWYIEDLGSETGTFIGACQVTQKQKLSPGNLISVGNQKFKFGVPSRDPVPVAEETTQPQSDLASEIRKSKYSIFAGGQKNGNKGQDGGKKKSKLGNVIFTLIVVTLPLVIICGYMTVLKKKELDSKKEKSKPLQHPLFLYYEKIVTKADNVYRFEVKIEGKKAYFTIDDLKYGRHFVDEQALDDARIEKLKEELKKNEFHKLKNEKNNVEIGSVGQYRRIDLALDGEFNSIIEHGEYGKKSFERVEQAVCSLAEFYNIYLMTAEEMRTRAKEHFINAEELHKNYLASPKNIREAIDKYKAAQRIYVQFEPKPKEWSIGQKKLEEAQALYKTIHDNLLFNIQKYNKENRPDLASQACSKMLELVAPGSDDYQKYRDYKIEFDRKINAQKKKKRKK